MELLQFIFQDAGHFFGTCLILIIVFNGTAEVIKAFRRSKKSLFDKPSQPVKRKKTVEVEEAKIMD